MKKFLMILIYFVLVTNSIAQISNFVFNVKIENAIEGESLKLTAELYNIENIYRIEIVYKTFGESEYKNLEMVISGTQATVSIPSEETIPPFIEYYLLIQLKDGSKQTYPLEIEQGASPIQIAISSKSEKSNQVIVLSPEENEVMTEDDFLISLSFVRASDIIDITRTKIFLNGIDISSKAIVDQELITITREQIGDINLENDYKVEIKIYDKNGNFVSTLSRNFKVVSQQVARAMESEFKYMGLIKAEARNENTNSNQIFYKNILADFNSSFYDWQLNANAYFTSEEKDNLQPFNRYTLSIQNGDLLSLKIGDAFPRFPNLILDGKRVRGFTGELNLGFFNIQTSYGEINRKIEGKLLQTYSANDVQLANDIISINQSKYNAPFGKVIFGSFNRQLFAIRPSFGSGENFQLGFSYLHSIDDKNSIEFGTRPKENVVIGSDLKLAFDNNNILLTSQAAVSVINKDISTGTLNDAQIDSIFTTNKDLNINASDVKKIRDLIDKFITVNQYLGPWNPQKLSSLGAESSLTLNYFNNNIKATYIYRGNDYQSFGQSYLRTDIKGINLIDRIRMLDNKLFLSVGYESLKDNLQNTKLTTTQFNTISASISYFPRMNFPNITIGYSNNHNKNGFDLNDIQFGKYAIDETTNRISLIATYDVFYLVKHSTSFTFSNSVRKVKSFQNGDSKYSNISFNVSSYWNKNLVSTFGLIYNNLEYYGYPFNYFTFSIGGKYTLPENKLSLSGNISPSFGDFKRQTFELLVNYNLLENFVISFQARVFRIPDKSTNSIVGLITRLNI
jgi:hypothetical protein